MYLILQRVCWLQNRQLKNVFTTLYFYSIKKQHWQHYFEKSWAALSLLTTTREVIGTFKVEQFDKTVDAESLIELFTW